MFLFEALGWGEVAVGIKVVSDVCGGRDERLGQEVVESGRASREAAKSDRR